MTMNKTLLIVIGQPNYFGPNFLETLGFNSSTHTFVSLDYCTPALKYEVNEILSHYDLETHLDDVIFITTSEQASRWIISNKYNEKVAYYGNADTGSYRGPTVSWTNQDELPSIIKKLEGNVSEDANF
jgi:hypothetical protein